VNDSSASDRVVVIGGSGFIGKRVVAALRASGWAQPVILTRRPVMSAYAVDTVCADATNEAVLRIALCGAAAVVNCVAGDAHTIRRNAHALFAAAGACTPKPRVVYLSSMAVYGSTTGHVTESAPVEDSSPYASAKIVAERTAATYPRAVILRPGIVYGPQSHWWSVQIARLLKARRLGELGALGQGTCNLLYVNDMANAVLQALRQPAVEGRTFNLAMSDPPTWNEYFAAYAQALGVTPLTHVSPTRLALELRVLGPALRALQLAARAAHLPFEPPTAIRPWLTRLTQQRIRLDVAAAERELRMLWTPLVQGLRATLA
jgi:2-alkyl-3-oxoalkanoate reductase